MLYSEVIAVCFQIHTKHINTLCGQNVQLLNVKLVVHIVVTTATGIILYRIPHYDTLTYHLTTCAVTQNHHYQQTNERTTNPSHLIYRPRNSFNGYSCLD